MDSSDTKTVVTVVSNFKFLNNYINNIYDQLRGNKRGSDLRGILL